VCNWQNLLARQEIYEKLQRIMLKIRTNKLELSSLLDHFFIPFLFCELFGIMIAAEK